VIDDLRSFEISEAALDDPNSEQRDMADIITSGRFECAPTKSAEYPVGVIYRGPWETEWAGVQSSVRRHARALAKTGMPVWLVSLNHQMEYLDEDGNIASGFADHTSLAPSVVREVGHLTTCKHAQSLVSIEHRVFSPEAIISLAYPAGMMRVDPTYVRRVNATTILFTVLERSEPDEDTRRAVFAMSLLGEVWVPCERNRRVLVDSGVPEDKIWVMPHPIPSNDELWLHKHCPPKDRIRLVNIGKWEPRKGQHELIGGFLKAFKPDDKIELVMKYAPFGVWKDYPATPQESVATWMQDSGVQANGWTVDSIQKRLLLFGQYLPRSVLVRYLAESHIYVSAGRAEGFDMSALDAKILGLRLVVMGHGGAEDFCETSDVQVVSKPVPAHPGYDWNGAKWAGYNVDDMSDALRAAVDLERRGDTKVPLNPTPFMEVEVGRRMLDRCLSLSRQLGGDVEFEPVEEYRNA